MISVIVISAVVAVLIILRQYCKSRGEAKDIVMGDCRDVTLISYKEGGEFFYFLFYNWDWNYPVKSRFAIDLSYQIARSIRCIDQQKQFHTLKCLVMNDWESALLAGVGLAFAIFLFRICVLCGRRMERSQAETCPRNCPARGTKHSITLEPGEKPYRAINLGLNPTKP